MASMIHRLVDWADREAERPAFFEQKNGSWDGMSWGEVRTRAFAIGAGLRRLGVSRGEAVAIMGPNRRDFALVQLGAWTIGAIACPIYQTSTDDQVRYIAEDAGAKVAVAGDGTSLAKLRAAAPATVRTFVSMDPAQGATPLSELTSEDGTAVEAELEQLNEDTVALLIYTSGTTGKPKGAQLDHGNMLAVTQGGTQHFAFLAGSDAEYRLVSYLPLAHVAEQMFTMMMAVDLGGVVYFCPVLEDMKTVLPVARPTIFVGVPRVWEKFQAALSARLAEATGVKKKLAQWALRTELAGFDADVARGGAQKVGFARGLARRLVVDKIKAKLGFDQLQLACAGAAPASVECMRFFASLGIVIHEGFGMTETAGAVIASRYMQPVFGAVGVPFPGIEAKIASDGELLLRGRAMTRGYHQLPAETADLLDADGWLHTGDLGSMDPDGSIRITGRKKEIIITAGGKNVAPTELEAKLQGIDGIMQAVVVGDRRPYLVALLTLDPDARARIAAEYGVSPEALGETPGFLTAVQEGIDRVNAGLARYQTVKKFALLPREFSVDEGELTPSMKLKRPVIHARYEDIVSGLYDAGAAAPKLTAV